ncbi:MAG TPA: rod shape-determining protein MreD [Vicinamibacterales bacterium]|nr:rod shape-determining protein MreD [Vicinamibacterales bacterium]
MRFVINLAALAAALALQTTLTNYVQQTAALDFVLVMVVSLALTSGPTTGVLAGSVAGLVQDALSSGVVGIGALAKTVVGFAVGRVGTQFIVTAPLPRFVVFLAATLVHAALFMGLYVLLGLRSFPAPYGAVGGQAVGNAVVGVIGFQIWEWLPGFLARRRQRRPGRR